MYKLKLIGLTLIELIITLSVVAILAGVSIKQISLIKRVKDTVDNTTDLIINQLNQANFSSIGSTTSNNQAAKVCSIKAGTGTANASCDSAASTWQNINNININQKVQVTIVSTRNDGSNAGINLVTYQNGLINDTTLGSSTTPAFTITVKGTTADNNCTAATNNLPVNTIKIWQNGVIDVTRIC